jgi:hypothetical protein
MRRSLSAENGAEAPGEVKNGLPMLVTGILVNRDDRRAGCGRAAVAPMVVTGSSRAQRKSYSQAQPSAGAARSPHRVLFCHEGAWHQVDVSGRSAPTGRSEADAQADNAVRIAGTSFQLDGKWVWYDQTAAVEGILAGRREHRDGRAIRYPVAREHWSVHYNISRDGRLFASDSGRPGSVANKRRCAAETLNPPGMGSGYLFRRWAVGAGSGDPR